MRAVARPRADERGETLVELMVAIVIMGIAVAAILGGMATSVVAGDIHRKQATAGTYARDYAEFLASHVGGDDDAYQPCAGTADYPPFKAAGAGFAVTLVGVRYWDGTGWVAGCDTDRGVQQLTVQAASSDGRATERVTVVVRKPCGGTACT